MTETDTILSLVEGDDAASDDDCHLRRKRQAVEFANRMAFELTGHNVANDSSANKLSHFALNPPPKVKEYTLTGLSHDDVRKIGNKFSAADAERAAVKPTRKRTTRSAHRSRCACVFESGGGRGRRGGNASARRTKT